MWADEQQEGTPGSTISAETCEKVDRLLAKMTIEEKVGQMTQITLDVLGKGDDVFGSYEEQPVTITETRVFP